MTEAKHTAGPWTVESSDEGGFVIEKDGYLVIASRGPHEKRANEMLANARLISAAPELLASVRMLMTAIENIGGEHVTGLEGINCVMDTAQAVIAKATGEQA